LVEELTLDRPVGRVPAIDWVPPRPERTEGLMLVYGGGVLPPDDIKAIRPPPTMLARTRSSGGNESPNWRTRCRPAASPPA
jgi:8-oxo-dGTP diphosphatase